MADAEESGKDFLGRWSERKLRARETVELDLPPAPESQSLAAETEEPEDAPTLTDADMPPLESLDESSDYSGFLSPGVSDALRRKALSKLFHSPRLNLVDGLDDYAEDFASFIPLGEIVTADMRHRMEQAAKRLLAEDGDAVDAADTSVAEPAERVDDAESKDKLDGPDLDPDGAEEEV